MKKNSSSFVRESGMYIGPSPQLCMREFIITKSFSSNLKAFASKASLDMFKHFKGLSPQQQNFFRAKELQNQSKGLPLLVLKRVHELGLGDTKYMKIYKCLPSPESRDRLYDKVDNSIFTVVYKRTFPSYIRFSLKFDNSTEIIMILHSRFPIADIAVGDKRYRFVRDRSYFMSTGYFMSDLYLLPPDKVSLTDDLTSDKKVNKRNKLLGNLIKNVLAPVSFKSTTEFTSQFECGKFVNDHLPRFGNDHKNSSFSVLSTDCDFDSNNAVRFEDIVLICACMILTNHDIDERRRRHQ